MKRGESINQRAESVGSLSVWKFAMVFVIVISSHAVRANADAQPIPILRLVQHLDTSAGTEERGSTRTSFALAATTITADMFVPHSDADAPITRAALVMPLDGTISVDKVVDAIRLHEAAILLLPIDEKSKEAAEQVLRTLARMPSFSTAVYVSHVSPKWEDLLHQLRAAPYDPSWYLAAVASEPSPLKDFAPKTLQVCNHSLLCLNSKQPQRSQETAGLFVVSSL
eukprot:TRINITY_DN3771_c0_g1_i2.p1 TRINITY_DN3771_c0_g1~~TRINITY_DN3771_c0_g1_i2.p1  ORF type:complete len:226 (+),score=49.94 TRINITY_DN3771_c0_g1_i2:67-744(+)